MTVGILTGQNFLHFFYNYVYWFWNCLSKFIKKVIQPALTRIKKGAFVKRNQEIDILGNTANYINPKKIMADEQPIIKMNPCINEWFVLNQIA